MNRLAFFAFITASGVLSSLGGCKSNGTSGNVIATVGNTKVYADEFLTYLSNLPPATRQEAIQPEQRLIFLKGYLYQRSIAVLARSKGIDKDPEYLQSIAAYQNTQLNRIYSQRLTKQIQVTESEAREHYKAHSTEYLQGTIHASHIVTSTQADAEKAQKKLKSGKPFAEVASRMSIDTRTAREGGKMPPLKMRQTGQQNYAQIAALLNLKKGQHTQIIRTSAGYEILRLDRELTGTLMPFESVVTEIQNQLINRKAHEQLSADLKQINTQIHENEVNTLQIPQN